MSVPFSYLVRLPRDCPVYLVSHEGSSRILFPSHDPPGLDNNVIGNIRNPKEKKFNFVTQYRDYLAGGWG